MTASNGAGAAMAGSANDKPRRSYQQSRTAWCPVDQRAQNERLRAMGYTEAERQEIILADIPGTDAYKRRMEDNARDAARLPGLGFARDAGR